MITDFDGSQDQIEFFDKDGRAQTVDGLKRTQDADGNLLIWSPDLDSSVTVYGDTTALSFDIVDFGHFRQ